MACSSRSGPCCQRARAAPRAPRPQHGLVKLMQRQILTSDDFNVGKFGPSRQLSWCPRALRPRGQAARACLSVVAVAVGSWRAGRGCSQRCAKRRASDLHVPLETRGLRKHNDVANGTPPGVWFSKPQCLKREERGWGRVDTTKTQGKL